MAESKSEKKDEVKKETVKSPEPKTVKKSTVDWEGMGYASERAYNNFLILPPCFHYIRIINSYN